MVLIRSYSMGMKRNEEKGYHCLRPLEGWKVLEGESMMRKEKKVVETSDMIH